MPLALVCEHCGRKLKVGDNLIGKKVRCPHCKGVILVQKAEEASPPPAVPQPEPVASESPFSDNPFETDAPAYTATPSRSRSNSSEARTPTIQPNSQWTLRVAVMLCGVSGGFFAGLLGYAILQFLNTIEPAMEFVRLTKPDFYDRIQRFQTTSWLLLISTGVGLVGGVLAFFRWRWIGGIIMLAAGVLAGLKIWQLMFFTIPLGVGFLAALFIKSRRTVEAEVQTAIEQNKRRVPDNGIAMIMGHATIAIVVIHAGIMYKLYAIVEAVRKSDEKHVAEIRKQKDELGRIPKDRPDPLNPIAKKNPDDERPKPLPPFGDLETEIAKATEGINFVDLDLTSVGINAMIQVPEGARVQQEQAGHVVNITKKPHFELRMILGRRELIQAKQAAFAKAVAETPDLRVSEISDVRSTTYGFFYAKVLGYQDFTFNCLPDTERAHCMVMLKSAQSAKIKTSPPSDPTEALKPFLGKVRDLLSTTPPFPPLNNPGKEEVEVLSLNENTTDATLKLIGPRKELRALFLSGTQVTREGLSQLRELPNLEQLDIGRNQWFDEELSVLKQFPKLRALNLRWNPEIADDGIAHLKSLKELEWLSLEVAFAGTEKGLKHLQECQKLRSLFLQAVAVKGAGLVELSRLESLETLSLSFTSIPLEEWTQLKEFPNLKHLKVESAKLEDSVLKSFTVLKKLESLNLAQNEIQGVGLVELKNLPNLTHLNLAETRITNQSLEHLKDCRKLQHLNLSETAVTDAGLEPLGALSELKVLEVKRTKITPDGIAKLKEKIPNVQVIVGK